MIRAEAELKIYNSYIISQIYIAFKAVNTEQQIVY